jgi:hypothetical protein
MMDEDIAHPLHNDYHWGERANERASERAVGLRCKDKESIVVVIERAQ